MAFSTVAGMWRPVAAATPLAQWPRILPPPSAQQLRQHLAMASRLYRRGKGGAPVPRTSLPAVVAKNDTADRIFHSHHPERPVVDAIDAHSKIGRACQLRRHRVEPEGRQCPRLSLQQSSGQSCDVLGRTESSTSRAGSNRAPASISAENGAAAVATSSIFDAACEWNCRWRATVTTRKAASRSRATAASNASLAGARWADDQHIEAAASAEAQEIGYRLIEQHRGRPFAPMSPRQAERGEGSGPGRSAPPAGRRRRHSSRRGAEHRPFRSLAGQPAG